MRLPEGRGGREPAVTHATSCPGVLRENADLLAEVTRLRAANDRLAAAATFVLINLRTMPPPRLGELNWPLLIAELESALPPAEERKT